MANPKTITVSMENEEPKPAPLAPADIDLNDEVAKAIKTRFVRPDLTVGKAHLLDPRAHHDIDYTAGGQLHMRWVINSDVELQKKGNKGFVLPEAISPRLKNIKQGNLILMVRPADYDQQHQHNVERLNRQWEANAAVEKQKKNSNNKGIGEYDVTPQAAKRS